MARVERRTYSWADSCLKKGLEAKLQRPLPAPGLSLKASGGSKGRSLHQGSPRRPLAAPGPTLHESRFFVISAEPLKFWGGPFDTSFGARRAKRRWPGWSAEHIPGQTAVSKRPWRPGSRGRSLHQGSPTLRSKNFGAVPFETSFGAWRAKRRWPGSSAEHIPGQTAVLKRAWRPSSRGRSLHQGSP